MVYMGSLRFGYMFDLLWAQAFGLVLSSIQQEFGFDNDQSGNISVAFSAGLTAGAFVWGVSSRHCWYGYSDVGLRMQC